MNKSIVMKLYKCYCWCKSLCNNLINTSNNKQLLGIEFVIFFITE